MKSEIVERVHARAMKAAKKYLESEIEMIESLELADKHRVHLAFECNSLFAYATKILGLSEDRACTFINLARKSREVPALKQEISAGRITASKANRLCSVLNKENQTHWLQAAAKSSKRELEKLIAEENPRAAVVEKTAYASKDRIELQVGVSAKLMISLRRAQDVLSQKRRRAVSLEETFEAAIATFNQKYDPLERAKRQLVKGRLMDQAASNSKAGAQNGIQSGVQSGVTGFGTQDSAVLSGPGRIKLPASTRHKINIAFEGQCSYTDKTGERCKQKRFLDIHHKQPLSEGGSNEPDNLELLCSGHHQSKHH